MRRILLFIFVISFYTLLFGYNANDLFVSAKSGTKSQIEMIIQDGVSIEVRDADGNTPVIASAIAGKDELVIFLLEKGADLQTTNIKGRTALMEASLNSQLKVIRAILKKAGNNNINLQDVDGNSALMLASSGKNAEAIELLIENGADINVLNNSGENAILLAAKFNNRDAATYLYSKGGILPRQYESAYSWVMAPEKEQGNIIVKYFKDFLKTTSFHHFAWGNLIMILVGICFLILAMRFGFEPLLLIPIGFGIIIGNIPVAFGDAVGLYEKGSVLNYLYFGVKEGIYPPLIFLGIGALTDFSYMISNPKLILLGAAAQVGVFVALLGAYYLGFSIQEAASIGIIGGADGPTTIFVTSKMAPYLIGATAIAGYSYMALVPVIQRPIIYLMTTKKERLIRMASPRKVSKIEKLIFPVATFILCCFIAPGALPLMGMLLLGNLLKESGYTDRLAKTAGNAMVDIVTILVGLSVGASTSAEYFLTPSTLLIVLIGAIAFIFSTIGGIGIAKIMNLFLKEGNKINPIIGCAGVSAVPIAARVAHTVGREADPENHLLMHAMAPNVAGVIGSAIAAGILLGLIPH